VPQITKHFSVDEFVMTSHRDIDNSLPQSLYSNALETCEMLERIRAFLSQRAGRDIPINLTSGYRCPQLNRAVGSSDSSDHIRAWAGDWTARQFGSPYQVCQALAPKVDELGIGQLIHEFGSWIHVGVPKPSKQVNRIITIDRYEGKVRTRVGIHAV